MALTLDIVTPERRVLSVTCDEVRAPGVQGGFGVRLADTIRGFKEILDGKHDDLPEQAFYMVGTIEEAVAKAKKLV